MDGSLSSAGFNQSNVVCRRGYGVYQFGNDGLLWYPYDDIQSGVEIAEKGDDKP
jgi:hypothetical protein